MPISSQCLQNKKIGEFYNETNKECNRLFMRCNSKHNNRVDNCNDYLSNFKESGVAMDFISATNNHCPDFRKKTSVDTTKKTLVTLAIFLLSIKQADSSLHSNSSKEGLTTTPPSFNHINLNSHELNIFDGDRRKDFIDSPLVVKSNWVKNKEVTRRVKRMDGQERYTEKGLEEFKEIIKNTSIELSYYDDGYNMKEIKCIIRKNRKQWGMNYLPDEFNMTMLPKPFRLAIIEILDSEREPT